MGVSMKDLNKHNAPAPPVANDVEQRLGQMRLAAARAEERVMRAGCASTGETYLVRFRRKTVDGLLEVAALEKGEQPSSSARTGLLFRKAAPEPPARYSWKEFDRSAWQSCVCCGDRNGITLCDRCGRQMCGAKTRTLPGGREQFRCHDSCGAVFETAPATEVTTDTGGRGVMQLPATGARLRLTGPCK